MLAYFFGVRLRCVLLVGREALFGCLGVGRRALRGAAGRDLVVDGQRVALAAASAGEHGAQWQVDAMDGGTVSAALGPMTCEVVECIAKSHKGRR
jgi:hypothetical protein